MCPGSHLSEVVYRNCVGKTQTLLASHRIAAYIIYRVWIPNHI